MITQRSLDLILIEKPRIDHEICGTQEQWDKRPDLHDKTYRIIPAKIYVNKTDLYLVTSQEWCDWLHGKTDKVPEVEENGREIK